jgi:hypothetical protein
VPIELGRNQLKGIILPLFFHSSFLSILVLITCVLTPSLKKAASPFVEVISTFCPPHCTRTHARTHARMREGEGREREREREGEGEGEGEGKEEGEQERERCISHILKIVFWNTILGHISPAR